MWAPHLSGEIALPLPDLWSEVKVSQSCPTFCNPMDYTIHGILQAIPFYRDRIRVSRMAGGFLISWATREARQMVWPLVKPEDVPGHVDSSLNWKGEEGRGERREELRERGKKKGLFLLPFNWFSSSCSFKLACLPECCPCSSPTGPFSLAFLGVL